MMCLSKRENSQRDGKQAHVCPIPKTKPASIDNLRPIALLPVRSKILERIVLEELRPIFIQHFGEDQFGSRPSSSTTCALIKVLHHCLSMLEKPNVMGIQIIAYDYAKAFDKLSHNVILRQLKMKDFPTPFVEWTKSYLNQRSQAVRIGTALSNYLPSPSGVPQGSVLGPLLFCLSIADLEVMYDSSQLVKYVDDVTLSVPLFKEDSNSHVKEEHANFLSWSSMNGFEVNLKKCKSLSFLKSKEQKPVPLNDVIPVTSLKFLGFILNQSLSWNDHIQNICALASRRMYALRIIKPIISKNNLKLVYDGLIRSILEYGSPAFGNLPKVLSDKLEKIQSRCHRLICGSSDCNCGMFLALSERRMEASKKLFRKSSVSITHVLHSIIPPQSYRSNRFIQQPSLTSRYLSSFIPHTIQF